MIFILFFNTIYLYNQCLVQVFTHTSSKSNLKQRPVHVILGIQFKV